MERPELVRNLRWQGFPWLRRTPDSVRSKLAAFWQEHVGWLQVGLAALTGVLGTLASDVATSFKAIILLLLALTCLAAFSAWRQSGSKRELERSNTALQAEVQAHERALEQVHQVVWDLWADVLEFLVRDLKFTPRDRVSIYKHQGNHFIPLGRYCSNPKFAARGRPYYPDNQGCIGRAWHAGEFVIEELPDPDVYPYLYIVAQQEYGLDEETVRGLTMKSRTYGGFVIEDSGRRRNIAIIVFESTDAQRFNYDIVREVVRNSSSLLANLIRVLNNLGVTPTITAPVREGAP